MSLLIYSDDISLLIRGDMSLLIPYSDDISLLI